MPPPSLPKISGRGLTQTFCDHLENNTYLRSTNMPQREGCKVVPEASLEQDGRGISFVLYSWL